MSTESGHWVYTDVTRTCVALRAMGCDIITGGGPGLMQAANEGAKEAQDMRIPQFVDGADEAIAIIREAPARWKGEGG